MVLTWFHQKTNPSFDSIIFKKLDLTIKTKCWSSLRKTMTIKHTNIWCNVWKIGFAHQTHQNLGIISENIELIIKNVIKPTETIFWHLITVSMCREKPTATNCLRLHCEATRTALGTWWCSRIGPAVELNLRPIPTCQESWSAQQKPAVCMNSVTIFGGYHGGFQVSIHSFMLKPEFQVGWCTHPTLDVR